jgi:hypothetical protein
MQVIDVITLRTRNQRLDPLWQAIQDDGVSSMVGADAKNDFRRLLAEHSNVPSPLRAPIERHRLEDD